MAITKNIVVHKQRIVFIISLLLLEIFNRFSVRNDIFYPLPEKCQGKIPVSIEISPNHKGTKNTIGFVKSVKNISNFRFQFLRKEEEILMQITTHLGQE